MTSANRCAAGAIRGEWKAPLTLSGITRRGAPLSGQLAGMSHAVDDPADHHLARRVEVADHDHLPRGADLGAHRADTASTSSPITAAMVPSFIAAISRPRRMTMRIASSGV